MDQRLEAFGRLLKIMDELRAGCPWDREQTFESLRHLTIEETYELSDAIMDHDLNEVKKELGDLMLHLVFYAKIGEEQGAFDIKDVLESISEKLIIRHPHIYGEVKVNGSDDVKENWERIKLKEGKKSVLEGVPQSLPALLKAYRMQEKAGGVGFEWEHKDQVWDKVLEELQELKTEADLESPLHRREDEFGDLLFALVNYARYVGINPEDALEHTNRKFKSRFSHIEKVAEQQGKKLHEMSLEEMDGLWNQAKTLE
ncbi:MAG: nucleoside triphosphate pyrophosphohydrolase [Bacteroidales bacterium]|jgi:XTP/dITP diphosphohydrolase|nr:nucleoside triphosphate pyrophosphohydrolase [Bacteroidales bacterium]